MRSRAIADGDDRVSPLDTLFHSRIYGVPDPIIRKYGSLTLNGLAVGYSKFTTVPDAKYGSKFFMSQAKFHVEAKPADFVSNFC